MTLSTCTTTKFPLHSPQPTFNGKWPSLAIIFSHTKIKIGFLGLTEKKAGIFNLENKKNIAGDKKTLALLTSAAK